MAARSFDRPRGTRDLYPEDYLQRRYITETWRRVALRHGFDEIDGPTFEHLDLYTVKSGEGIVSELFSFSRAGGDETYALRPEYTPTLARQYAARAGQLAKPTRWFSIGPYFRAERPQRGRLREFLQWNVDVLGDNDDIESNAELLTTLADSLCEFGLQNHDARIHYSDRNICAALLHRIGVRDADINDAMILLDKADVANQSEIFIDATKKINLDIEKYQRESMQLKSLYHSHAQQASQASDVETTPLWQYLDKYAAPGRELILLHAYLFWYGHCEYTTLDFDIVRGLAYYTGLVFEARAEGERAVAGGGRYDNLIELLGGPPTPAVGFAMGDVVLANLLEDKGLMPRGKDLLAALSQPVPTRPDVFVISAAGIPPVHEVRTMARLRRGVERDGRREPWHPDRYEVPPLHARRSYKATRNVGKLLKDAASANARFAVIVESDARATVKDLDSGEQWSDKVALDDLATRLSAAL